MGLPRQMRDVASPYPRGRRNVHMCHNQSLKRQGLRLSNWSRELSRCLGTQPLMKHRFTAFPGMLSRFTLSVRSVAYSRTVGCRACQGILCNHLQTSEDGYGVIQRICPHLVPSRLPDYSTLNLLRLKTIVFQYLSIGRMYRNLV